MRWAGIPGKSAVLVAAACAAACVGDEPGVSVPGDAGAGGGNTCDGGVVCGGACVPVSSDHANCGACGRICDANQVCDQGKCSDTCTKGLRCEAAGAAFPSCVDVDVDPSNCGACGNVCPIASCAASECARRVFVTATSISGAIVGDAGAGALAAADDLCQSAARSGALTGTYHAWLSDGTGSPSTHFTRGKAPYVLVDGTEIAASFDALVTTGQLESPIRKTATNAIVTPSAPVWTGTAPNGTGVSSDTCLGWTSASATNPPATIGFTDEKASAWTQKTTQSCASEARLYCFEQ